MSKKKKEPSVKEQIQRVPSRDEIRRFITRSSGKHAPSKNPHEEKRVINMLWRAWENASTRAAFTEKVGEDLVFVEDQVEKAQKCAVIETFKMMPGNAKSLFDGIDRSVDPNPTDFDKLKGSVLTKETFEEAKRALKADVGEVES